MEQSVSSAAGVRRWHCGWHSTNASHDVDAVGAVGTYCCCRPSAPLVSTLVQFESVGSVTCTVGVAYWMGGGSST
jgi:hypothetical protein